jgi:OOP family OmpA-OmpF porin
VTRPYLMFIASAAFVLAAGSAVAQLQDHEGFKDPALFTRMPNYFLSEGGAFEEREFDAHDFWVKKGAREVQQHVEGRYSLYRYSFDESRGAAASALQILRNYQNAATRIGGKVLYDNGEITTIRVASPGKETWAEVAAYGVSYSLLLIERETMKQDVAANADALKAGLREVAKLLQANPSMKVWVVGHTDNAGSAETNVTLSNARAVAVIRMLTQQMGVDARRLAPHGAGPYAPVATNKTDEGRARNRRVELVEQP